LPEVETVRRELEPWLVGRTVLAVERLAPAGPKYARLEALQARRIEAVNRRGKFLLLPLGERDVRAGTDDAALELIIHLGMTGVIAAEAPHGAAAGHERVRLTLDGDEPMTLHFIDPRRFGRFLVVPAGDYATLPTLATLGPEPLGPDFTTAAFAASLSRSTMPIKAYLLSQRPVAGVGNIYADEALWRAGVNPLTPAARVSPSRAAALREAIRDVLSASLAAQGTTLNDYRTVAGEAGSFAEYLDVYGHAGEACRRCGTQLRRIVVGQRGTVYCPGCQPDGATRPRGARPRAARSYDARAREPKTRQGTRSAKVST